MKIKYEPLLIFFTFFIIAIVIIELVTGCAITFSKIPTDSGFTCKSENFLGYVVNLVFQSFIILIILLWNYLVYAKKNSNK